MTFSIYIRTIMESYLFILLSWISDISYQKLSNNVEIVSFCFSVLLLVLLSAFLFIWTWKIWKIRKNNVPKEIYFSEFFEGLKQNKKSKWYSIIFMLQRVLSCILLIVFANLNYKIKVSLLTFIQAVTAWYAIIVRPYQALKDMVLEVYSQVMLTSFWFILIFYEKEEKLTSTTNWIFVGPIVLSSIICIFISVMELIIQAKKLYEKKWNKQSKINNIKI